MFSVEKSDSKLYKEIKEEMLPQILSLPLRAHLLHLRVFPFVLISMQIFVSFLQN